MTPEIIAHRGASYLAPENTLAAFKKAMEIGADGIEMDVQQTSDGGLVIHHDYIIDLHTDISGKIYDMTMGELRELDFGSWKDIIFKDERIATLQEAMELCRQMPTCTVFLELKATMNNDPEFVPRVLEVLRNVDIVEQVVLISFNHDLLRQAKQLLPQIRVGALLYGAVESILFPASFWELSGIAGDWQEENGLPEAADTASAAAAEEQNCLNSSWMTRWMNDKIAMLRASFPGSTMREIAQNLARQNDPVAYIQSLDFPVEWVSCEYHTAYEYPRFVGQLQKCGVKVALWTVDTENAVKLLLQTGPDAYITNRPDRVREWLANAQKTAAAG